MFSHYYSRHQVQQQVNKQDLKLLQLQAQNNSNRLLVLLLSSAENVAAKLNPEIERIYTDHDFCHSFESKSLDALVLQLIDQIETFESSYKRYKKEYKKEYDFPYNKETRKGISKEMIIDDMKYLIDNTVKINKNYSKYFKSIINILNDEPTTNFDADVLNLDIKDKNREKKCNPKELEQVYPILLQQGLEEKKEIEENYNKDKNYQIVIEKSANNNNQIYEKEIQEKLRKVKDYKEDPVQTKKNIKHWKLGTFDNYFEDFPFIIVTNINKVLNDNRFLTFQNTLYETLKNQKNLNLNKVLTEFFKNYFGHNNATINKIIDATCEEIYKREFNTDMK